MAKFRDSTDSASIVLDPAPAADGGAAASAADVPVHDRSIGDFDTIVKYDDITGDREIWSAGPSGHVGESVFAPDPDGTAEDDGWLINAVYDSATDRTDICLLDAHDVTTGPVARVHLTRRMPFGFHANWFAAD